VGDDPFAGIVTGATIYGKLVEVGERVAQVGERVAAVDAKVDGLIEGHRDHEKRIRDLEAGRWPHGKLTLLLSAAGLLVAVAAVAVAWWSATRP
jgi:hypothetical protein